MRHWRQRTAVLLIILLLAAGLRPSAAETPDVYLVAINDMEVLEVKQETMPFWSGGHLYVSEEVFSGASRTALGVGCSKPPNKPVVLYSLSSIGVALFFDLETGAVNDGQNNTYRLPAIQRGSTVFFPLDLVTSVLGLTYSYTPTSPAPVIRIKNPAASQLPDDVFLDAAASILQSRYDAYLNSLTAPPTQETPVTTPAPTGQRVYLIFTVEDPAAARSVMDALTRREMQGTFLFRPEQIPENADFIRALTANGQGLGLILSGDGDETSAERGGELLWQAARTRTRLVWPEGLTPETEARLRGAGYCLMNSRLHAKPLTSTNRADTLYDQIAGLAGPDRTAFLGYAEENLIGLNSLLTRLRDARCRVIAYRETLPS